MNFSLSKQTGRVGVTAASMRLAAVLAVALPLLSWGSMVQGQGAGSALRFFGNGDDDIDRAKIRIDDPSNNNPGPPADIGNEDFTIEFWMKANPGDNPAGSVSCGTRYSWITGNVIFDRDRFEQQRGFGLSIAGRRLAWGILGDGDQIQTICGSITVDDGQWHHIALERRRSDGRMWMYVDGRLDAEADGPDGDISYPDDGIPRNKCEGSCDFSDPFIVIGAEKHDASPAAYTGWFDELRLSSTLRYSGGFSPPTEPFTPDSDTVGLYHFDEGAGDVIRDASGAAGGPSHGVRRFGGNPAGPVWVASDAPLSGGSAGLPVPPSDFSVN